MLSPSKRQLKCCKTRCSQERSKSFYYAREVRANCIHDALENAKRELYEIMPAP